MTVELGRRHNKGAMTHGTTQHPDPKGAERLLSEGAVLGKLCEHVALLHPGKAVTSHPVDTCCWHNPGGSIGEINSPGLLFEFPLQDLGLR